MPIKKVVRKPLRRIVKRKRLVAKHKARAIMAVPSKPGKPVVRSVTTGSLLHKPDFVYKGAFRVPTISIPDSTYGYSYGGTALAYNPYNNTLVMCGHDHKQFMGEFSIPIPKITSTVAGLNVAQSIRNPSDWLLGKRLTVDGNTTSGVKIGGCIPLGNGEYILTAWDYYDASAVKQTISHFITNTTTVVKGPFQVGKGFQKYYPPDIVTIAGMVSGYVCSIPSNLHVLANGTHLTGQGGGISIVGRTSSGPGGNIFNPTHLENIIPCPAELTVGYPSQGTNFTHTTLGVWRWGGGLGLYDGTQYFRGMLFPENFMSVLYFGWRGTEFCYGARTLDPALHRQPVPNQGNQIYCYDPATGGTGTHGYPYKSTVYAYNFGDFLSVRAGTIKPWEVVPYDVWDWQFPYQEKITNGIDSGGYQITGAAYKPATKEIFLVANFSDGDRPVIHVLGLP